MKAQLSFFIIVLILISLGLSFLIESVEINEQSEYCLEDNYIQMADGVWSCVNISEGIRNNSLAYINNSLGNSLVYSNGETWYFR